LPKIVDHNEIKPIRDLVEMSSTQPEVPVRQKRDDSSRLVFDAIQKNTVGARAIESIKELIISGELKPGGALPAERDLAAMLGISRPTLREVISALCAMNVLESRHGAGTFVTSLEPALLLEPINFLLQVDGNEILHLFEVRRILEVGAVRLAAQRITDSELDTLIDLTESEKSALGEPMRYLQFDIDIHTAIIHATKNPIFINLYESISQLSLQSRQRTVLVEDTRKRAHADHEAIIDALKSHDEERSSSAMHSHLGNVEQSFRANILLSH
jgi:GntR family transcriptional repressor for pyruvate dehydrogenase complex